MALHLGKIRGSSFWASAAISFGALVVLMGSLSVDALQADERTGAGATTAKEAIAQMGDYISAMERAHTEGNFEGIHNAGYSVEQAVLQLQKEIAEREAALDALGFVVETVNTASEHDDSVTLDLYMPALRTNADIVLNHMANPD